ncbi:MAG: hypothetical protein AMJ61_08735, partial [Desulfobacterales bacterium SG8_35_2]
MTHYRTHKWIFYLLIILFLAACSDSNNSAVNLPGGDVMQGVAVDPYIEGAVFQEIDADTGAVLQESSPSNALGVFVFPDPLTPGSIIELKDTEKGLHGGAPYLGMLRRVIAAADQNPVVVSPLTTLLANGITPEELIAALHDAGLTSLTTSDLYADPMVRLSNITAEVTDQDLALLQASMAVNAYMEITGLFEAGLIEMNDPAHLAIFDTMLNIIVNLLNTGEFETITAALANDPDVTTPLIPEDFVHAAMAELRTIIALAQEGMANNNGTFDPVIIMQAEQDALQNCVENVKSSYSQRVPASTAHDGALLYHDNCAACHQPLDVTEKPGRTAADIQNAIDNNLGYMGFLSTLTEGEVQAIADVLPAPPVVDPGTPPDGTALYSSNCAGCHNPL